MQPRQTLLQWCRLEEGSQPKHVPVRGRSYTICLTSCPWAVSPVKEEDPETVCTPNRDSNIDLGKNIITCFKFSLLGNHLESSSKK